MSELETIFYGLATSKDSASNVPCLDFDDFKSALKEFIESVTDDEMKQRVESTFTEHEYKDAYYLGMKRHKRELLKKIQ